MARTYHTLAPARYQVREGVRGGWYVLDTSPQGTDAYSRIEGTSPPRYVRDTFHIIGKDKRGNLFVTYQGAANLARRLETAAK